MTIKLILSEDVWMVMPDANGKTVELKEVNGELGVWIHWESYNTGIQKWRLLVEEEKNVKKAG